MKLLPIALTASTIILGATCVYLLQRLQSERERFSSEHGLRTQRERALAEVQDAKEDLEREVRALRREARAVRAAEAAHEQAALGAGFGAAGPIVGAVSSALGAPPAPTAGDQPSESARVLMQRMAAAMMYGELARELGLSPEDTDRLLELIGQQSQESMGAPTADPDPALLRRIDERQQNSESALATFLGPEKTAKYRAYQETLPERMELRSVRDHLDAFGTPLDDTQRAKLLALMVDEHKRAPDPGIRMDAVEEDMQRQQQWRQDSQRRILEQAGAVLAPEQRKRLQEYYDLQASTTTGPGGYTMFAVRTDEP